MGAAPHPRRGRQGGGAAAGGRRRADPRAVDHAAQEQLAGRQRAELQLRAERDEQRGGGVRAVVHRGPLGGPAAGPSAAPRARGRRAAAVAGACLLYTSVAADE